jgi:hypothetical protein
MGIRCGAARHPREERCKTERTHVGRSTKLKRAAHNLKGSRGEAHDSRAAERRARPAMEEQQHTATRERRGAEGALSAPATKGSKKEQSARPARDQGQQRGERRGGGLPGPRLPHTLRSKGQREAQTR